MLYNSSTSHKLVSDNLEKLALLKSGSDLAQTKITKYYDLLNDVTSFIEKHPNIIQECESKEKFNVIFQRLIANAEKNLKRHPQQVRHDNLLKKFATSLYIYCGSRAYNFISILGTRSPVNRYQNTLPSCAKQLNTVIMANL